MLETILCVDDDPITLMLCKMVITKATFSKKVATAKNGADALMYFDKLKEPNTSNTQPQLILLDLNMPVMGGWKFLEHFCNEAYSAFHSTKIIILSSTIDPEDFKKSKDFPMVIDFLSKPITKELLENLKEKLQFTP